MQLLQLAVEPSRLSWSHNNGVLQVHYAKPPALLAEVGGAELSHQSETDQSSCIGCGVTCVTVK